MTPPSVVCRQNTIFSPPKSLFSGVGNCFFLLTLLGRSVFFFPGEAITHSQCGWGAGTPPRFWGSGDIPVDVLKKEGQRLSPERSWLLPPRRISGVTAGPPESRRGRGWGWEWDPLLRGGMCCGGMCCVVASPLAEGPLFLSAPHPGQEVCVCSAPTQTAMTRRAKPRRSLPVPRTRMAIIRQTSTARWQTSWRLVRLWGERAEGSFMVQGVVLCR